MPITRTPMVDDDGSGTTGTIINNAWKSELYDQIDGLVGAQLGVWTAYPFSAANFTTDTAAVWTVEAAAVLIRYSLINPKLLLMSVDIRYGGLSASATYLRIRLPGGAVAAGESVAAAVNNSGTGFEPGYLTTAPGAPYLSCCRPAYGTWPTAAYGNVWVAGQAVFPIQ